MPGRVDALQLQQGQDNVRHFSLSTHRLFNLSKTQALNIIFLVLVFKKNSRKDLQIDYKLAVRLQLSQDDSCLQAVFEHCKTYSFYYNITVNCKYDVLLEKDVRGYLAVVAISRQDAGRLPA